MKITLKDIEIDFGGTLPESNLLDHFANEVAKKIASDKDAIIRKSITARIGPEWNLEDVLPRLRWYQERGKPESILALDDKPLITMWPAENHTEGNEMKWTIKYRKHQP